MSEVTMSAAQVAWFAAGVGVLFGAAGVLLVVVSAELALLILVAASVLFFGLWLWLYFACPAPSHSRRYRPRLRNAQPEHWGALASTTSRADRYDAQSLGGCSGQRADVIGVSCEDTPRDLVPDASATVGKVACEQRAAADE